ncbi:MAG: hypothetical protein PHS41_03230, partial [Victivallaceae bacterium]|nr:hypothetical protein [Victivallaceae bacterium]
MEEEKKNPFSASGSGGGENDLMKKLMAQIYFDVPALLRLLKRNLLVFLGVFLMVFVASHLAISTLARRSMKSWSGTAKLFHQSRSDRVPSFYKQLDSKSIAELVGTNAVLSRAAEKLNMPPYMASRLGPQVKIENAKNKNNIILITASYSNPKTAAELANAIAENGVSEYVELQNGTIKSILQERRRRKAQLSSELTTLENSRNRYLSRTSGFPPDEELRRLRMQISEKMTQIDSDRTLLNAYNIKIAQAKEALGKVDREILFMRKSFRGDLSELETMRRTLSHLKQLYTPENPRVKTLTDEIDAKAAAIRLAESEKKEGSAADEIVYSVNKVFTTLEETIATNAVEAAALQKNLELNQREVDRLRTVVVKLAEDMAVYRELDREISSASEAITQLDKSINDMDFLLNSAVPDLSIMERAVPPKSPNLRGVKIFAFAIALFVTGLLVFLLLLYEILFGKLRRSKEMAYVGKLDDIGEVVLPELEDEGAGRGELAVLNTFHALRPRVGDAYTILLTGSFEIGEMDSLLGGWMTQFGMNGQRVFRLRCLPLSLRDKSPADHAVGPQNEADDMLISVEKNGNRGYFYYGDPQMLAPAECDLLKADLAVLRKFYDVVLVVHSVRTWNVAIQFASIMDYFILALEEG